jgi:hypothetical protein
MSPDDTFVMAVDRALKSADVRTSIRQMHAEGYPLIKMVEALGLEEDMPQQVRDVLENLAPSVVAGIREATLEMLDGAEHAMPLKCMVTNAQLKSGQPIVVDVRPDEGQLTICVDPSTRVS